MQLGTRVSVMEVRNAIGCPTTDIGRLCSLSSDGSNYAFQIVENGYSAGNGYLFTDSTGYPSRWPYYNTFSNNAPGEWVATSNKFVEYRIKRRSLTSSYYQYSLGSFGGYNSDAAAPSVGPVEVTFAQGTSVSNYPVNIKNINLGDYSWTNLGAKYAKLVMYSDSSLDTAAYESGYFSITSSSNVATVNLTISTTGSWTQSYYMCIMLADSGYSDIGLLPTISQFTITVVAATTVRIFAKIQGQNGVSTQLNGTAVTGVYGNTTVSNTVKITNGHKQAKNYELTTVNTICKNASGTEVYNQDRSPDYRDYPTVYNDVNEVAVGSNLTMTAYIPTAAWNTISSTGCSVTVTLTLK